VAGERSGEPPVKFLQPRVPGCRDCTTRSGGAAAHLTRVVKLDGLVPQEALTLLEGSLRQVTQTTSASGIAMTAIGARAPDAPVVD
jgi:hypothetical protein